jgi:hypothetical protein
VPRYVNNPSIISWLLIQQLLSVERKILEFLVHPQSSRQVGAASCESGLNGALRSRTAPTHAHRECRSLTKLQRICASTPLPRIGAYHNRRGVAQAPHPPLTKNLRIARRHKDHRDTPIPASLASDERAICYRRLTAFINWKYLERKAKKGSGGSKEAHQ